MEVADGFDIVQLYASMLFRQAPQPGPYLLTEFSWGNIAEKDLERTRKQAEADHKKLRLDLGSLQWEWSLSRTDLAYEEYGVQF